MPETRVLDRATVVAVATIIGLLVVAIMHSVLPEVPAVLLLDRGGFGYPFSVQNAQWLVFAAGIGELIVRYQSGSLETRQLERGYLPEDEKTILEASDLGAVYKLARSSPLAETCFLPRLIQRAILQFQTTRSVDQASTLINSTLELYIHEIDLRYNMLRYIMWLIPSLGFLGTVVGIALALNYAGGADPGAPDLLSKTTSLLAVAFNTTIVALILASLLVFATNVIQGREERALNRAGQYCFDNLITRLYVR